MADSDSFVEEEVICFQETPLDTIANTMIWRAMDHVLNIENEKAYTLFEAGLNQDPSLFAPHVQLAMLSGGDKREHHKKMAKKLVAGKNEVSQLFVSLLDIERGPGAAEIWRSTWKKMHKLAYEGKYVHFRYAQSIEDPLARIAEFEKLAAKIEADGGNNGHVHNLLGYAHYTQGDKEKAKMHFNKYLELRPDGYNAYDSMADYFEEHVEEIEFTEEIICSEGTLFLLKNDESMNPKDYYPKLMVCWDEKNRTMKEVAEAIILMS